METMPEAFAPPKRIAETMAGFTRPWCIAGGWALDLYLGLETRPHWDIEIAVFRDDQRDLQRHLRGWRLEKVSPGSRERAPWAETERLSLPFHEIHACSADAEQAALEILLQEKMGEEWRFRRNLTVARPLTQVVLPSDLELPILAPEIVLLYKAKTTRPKDEEDFGRVRAALPPEPAAWLREAIRVCHPGHPWLERL